MCVRQLWRCTNLTDMTQERLCEDVVVGIYLMHNKFMSRQSTMLKDSFAVVHNNTIKQVLQEIEKER